MTMNIFKSLNRGKTVRFLIRIMLVISAAVLFVLSRFSVTGTFYARQYMGMESQLTQDSVLKNILMFILFLSLSLILGGMWKKLFKTGENKAAFVILPYLRISAIKNSFESSFISKYLYHISIVLYNSSSPEC